MRGWCRGFNDLLTTYWLSELTAFLNTDRTQPRKPPSPARLFLFAGS
jgi:hypothetical protein